LDDRVGVAFSVAIVVVTYNSAEVLSEFLDSLPAGLAGIEKARIFVADNASTDASVDIALGHPARPSVIAMGRNAGYAAAINAAAAFADPNDILIVFNPDMRLMPGSIRKLVDGLIRTDAGVAVPRLLWPDGSLCHSIRREPSNISAFAEALLGGNLAARLDLAEEVRDPKLYETGGPIDWASGAAVAVSPEVRARVGDWDESYFLYSEEVDYLRKVRDAGFKVIYVPESVMIHVGGDYHSNPRLSALMAANRIRYFERHHGAFAALFYRFAICLSAAIRASTGRAARAMFWASLQPWLPPPETVNDGGIQPKLVSGAKAR
jgi:N-acetylglucosaminyl-diphospho-decaprenol L-rhamnosyltransferase